MGDALRKYEERYRVSDWELWNDPWELIHGMPYCMSPAPAYRHQLLASNLLIELGSQLKKCPKCRVMIPIDWQIDEETVVQPDILILCKPHTGGRLLQTPFCLFEILSPSTRNKDRGIKFELYQQQGVIYYIMADPESKSIEAFQLGPSGKYQSIPSFPQLQLNLDGCMVELDMPGIWESLDGMMSE
jgi:Uma2 family endonuclease